MLSWHEVRVRASFTLCLLFVALSLLNGCGYRLPSQTAKPAVAGSTIGIALFANRSFRPNLESVLTNELVDEFAKRSVFTVVPGEGDLSLNGAILSYGTSAVSYSGTDTVREYRAAMTVEATLRRSASQQVLWKGTLSWSQDFPANTNIALQQNNEEAAIQEISRKIARQLYIKITEDF